MAVDDKAIIQLQVGSVQGARAEYVRDMKKALMEAVGSAQAVLLLGKTPKGEIRKRLLNPEKPEGFNNPMLSYVEHAYVEETLNLAFMLDWDSVVTNTRQVENDIVVEGYIECRFKNGKTVKKSGFGSARFNPGNRAVELGDAYKSAYSDMIKNAATKMGIGLDLYRHEESIRDDVNKAKAKEAGKPDGEKLGGEATESQLSTIKRLGGEPQPNMTFAQAAEKIRELAAMKNASKPTIPETKVKEDNGGTN